MKNNPLIIRVEEEKKIDFRVSMLRQRVTMQAILESFIDAFIAFDKGEKNSLIDKLIKKIHES
jgi:hypothetical protein